MRPMLSRICAELYHYSGGKEIHGPHSGLRGNVDACEITATERAAGINVLNLVAPKEAAEAAGRKK